jgi:predicted amidohydrolase YtcJ
MTAPMKPTIFLLTFALLLAACAAPAPEGPADLLLTGGRIWTGDPEQPWAEWLAVRGERIASVGSGEPVPEAARAMDLGGRLVVPGFNDSHVHFASAGELLLGANLLDVHDDEGFRKRILEAAGRLPAGSWITGGDWGAYEAWDMGSERSAGGETAYRPHRRLIDEATPDHPVLVTRFDRQLGLANARALAELGLESESGVLGGDELAAALERIPEKSLERRLAESRRALLACRRWGVTTVQDMSPMDQVDLYRSLREGGELTARIHFSPSRLDQLKTMLDQGWIIGAGDPWLRFGTIKTHIDGIMGNRTARFFEPYTDNSVEQAAWRGGWREFSADLEDFEKRLLYADSAKVQLRVHAIGDEANSILLDLLDRIEDKNGLRDRRFRLVHAQVLRGEDLDRLREHDIVAEVQPFHCADDMRWMEERIGHERSRGAYAFRSLMEADATLAFGSDWPGTNASYYPVNPMLGLYAAVTRQTVSGAPPEGWFPGERITLEDALRAYTLGGAYASFEDDLKGTLEPGKLADLAVLDTDLFETPPLEWLQARVDYTMVGGRIVYDRSSMTEQ